MRSSCYRTARLGSTSRRRARRRNALSVSISPSRASARTTPTDSSGTLSGVVQRAGPPVRPDPVAEFGEPVAGPQGDGLDGRAQTGRVEQVPRGEQVLQGVVAQRLGQRPSGLVLGVQGLRDEPATDGGQL